MQKFVVPYYRCSFNVCLWVFLSLIGLMVLSSSAFALQSGDFTYTVSGNTVTITKYTGTGGSVVIPATIDGMPVVGIGDYAFNYCTRLTSVTIPNSVTSIGDWAFYDCSGLTSVIIGNSVTSIADSAFYSCSGLTSIVVDANNTVYSSLDGVLYNKAMTVLIECPQGKAGGFIIPNSVTSIGDYAFYDCTRLTSVTIPNSVTSIGDWAFYYCLGLTSVNIPDSVTSIGKNAFQVCQSLTSVTIPNSVTSIGSRTFSYCSKLTSVIIPDSVTSIGDSAFYSCSKLTSVIIPNSVTSIGDSAFSECYGLTSVTIGNSVTSIGDSAFYSCSGLTSIVVDANNTVYSSLDGVLYNKAMTVLIECPQGKAGGFIIPNSVTSIGDYAFSECYGLTSVIIPNSVTSIGDGAFSYCSSLTSVTVPNSVTNIGYAAFYSCTGLTSVTIPDSVTSLGDWAFSYCSSLTSVTIGNSVTSIGKWVFSNCGLTSVTIPDSVTSLGDWAFVGCSRLTIVTIPNSVTSIGNYAFQSCTGLTSVIIPNSVTSIGAYAFCGCSGLTSVIIGNSVTSIDWGAFYRCTGLSTAYFYGNAPAMGFYVFYNCSNNFCVSYSAGSTGFTTPTWDGYPVCEEVLKDITSFTINNQISSIITECTPTCSSGTIAVTMPYDTNVTALVPTFTTTGVSVTVEGTPQASGDTANDFTNPVIYTVTAEDGTTKNYTVTVTLAKGATVITLTSFNATPVSERVILSWATASETDTAGFNIYRADSENGDYAKINASLIPTQGSSTQGAVYEFTDTNVQNRKTYYYKLEDIDLNGKSTMHGPESATPRLIYEVGK